MHTTTRDPSINHVHLYDHAHQCWSVTCNECTILERKGENGGGVIHVWGLYGNSVSSFWFCCETALKNLTLLKTVIKSLTPFLMSDHWQLPRLCIPPILAWHSCPMYECGSSNYPIPSAYRCLYLGPTLWLPIHLLLPLLKPTALAWVPVVLASWSPLYEHEPPHILLLYECGIIRINSKPILVWLGYWSLPPWTTKETNTLRRASRNTKQLEVNLTKLVQDLYRENCKTLRKIKDDLNKQNEIPRMGRPNIVIMSIRPNTMLIKS